MINAATARKAAKVRASAPGPLLSIHASKMLVIARDRKMIVRRTLFMSLQVVRSRHFLVRDSRHKMVPKIALCREAHVHATAMDSPVLVASGQLEDLVKVDVVKHVLLDVSHLENSAHAGSRNGIDSDVETSLHKGLSDVRQSLRKEL